MFLEAGLAGYFSIKLMLVMFWKLCILFGMEDEKSVSFECGSCSPRHNGWFFFICQISVTLVSGVHSYTPLLKSVSYDMKG